MKRICAALALLCLLAGCGSAGAGPVAMKDTTAQTTEQTTITVTKEQAMRLYEEFLAGKRDAKFQPPYNGEVCIDTLFTGDEWDRYAFFDMNDDGVPELHIRSSHGIYDIITCKGDELTVWGCPGHYAEPLNNGAILVTRHSADGSSYAYIEYDFYGNEQLRINFAKGLIPSLINGKYVYDENIGYWFEGEQVSMEEWDALTEPYFSIGSDKIEWIDVAPSAQQ